MNELRRARRIARCSRRRVDWRAWIASYTLVALLLPALGPLPWLVTDFGLQHGDQVPHEHQHAPGGHAYHSDFPGSPNHPAGHDCAPCQVLQCLAHCVVALHEPPRVAVQIILATTHWPPTRPSVVIAVAPPPPARGPPARLA